MSPNTSPSPPADADDDIGTDPGDAGGGRTVVHELSPECTLEDIEDDERYRATVNGVVEYGVFVDLSDHVSGLVHASNLVGDYDVGDELVVELETVRDDGDLSFVECDIEKYDTARVDHGEQVGVLELSGTVGSAVILEGEVVQIRQTGGPTVFQVSDGDGVVPCASFAGAGVRAYPDVEVGDALRVGGTVQQRDGAVQVEVDDLVRLDGEVESEVRDRVASAIDERAAPADIDPLVEWEVLDAMWEDLERVAERLRRAVLEGRPVKVRHHADGDGMCASVPLQLAVENFVAAVHEDTEAPRHLFRRLPSKAPYYEMEDVTRDLNFALEDRSRHGQKLPLMLMLDNGSTEEDTPAYRALAEYDIPIVVVDHHHPDPDAVEPFLEEHVNPYLHGEDYRVTTGMLCVEIARMIDPSLTDDIEHVPAVAGLSDRSAADAMESYLALADEAGYDESELEDVGEALDYAAYQLRYDDGGSFVNDALNVGCDDEDHHRELVSVLAERSERDTERQLESALPHVEHERLDSGANLYRIDVENHAHRFTYPAPGKTTGAIHDHMVEETGDPVITIGYGPDFAVLRSDGVRLDIPEMVTELTEELPGAGVSGGGHLVVGSIKFVEGRREAVLDALVEKMADAEIDEDLGSTLGS